MQLVLFHPICTLLPSVVPSERGPKFQKLLKPEYLADPMVMTRQVEPFSCALQRCHFNGVLKRNQTPSCLTATLANAQNAQTGEEDKEDSAKERKKRNTIGMKLMIRLDENSHCLLIMIYHAELTSCSFEKYFGTR